MSLTKQDLIDKHREINVDYDDWCDYVYDLFEEACHEVGVDILTTRSGRVSNGVHIYHRDIVWSGFWSQGDGAAFTGSVVDLEKAIANFATRYPMTYKYVVELKGYFKYWWKVGHRNNIDLQGLDVEDIDNYLEDDHPFAEIWQEQLWMELPDVEYELRTLADDLCIKLYDMLRDEYDALTTDEAVWETIVANDLHEETEDVERQRNNAEELLQYA